AAAAAAALQPQAPKPQARETTARCANSDLPAACTTGSTASRPPAAQRLSGPRPAAGRCSAHACVRQGAALPESGYRRRSEERRVGKECRSRWSPEQQEKKTEQNRQHEKTVTT